MEGLGEDRVEFVVVEHLDRLQTTQQQLLCDLSQVKDRIWSLEQARQRDHLLLTKLHRDVTNSTTKNDNEQIWLCWLPILMVGLMGVFLQSLLFQDTLDWGNQAAFVFILVLTGELLRLVYQRVWEGNAQEASQPEAESDSDSEDEECADEITMEMDGGDITGLNSNLEVQEENTATS